MRIRFGLELVVTVLLVTILLVTIVGVLPICASTNAPYSLWLFFDRAPQAVQIVDCRSTRSRQCEQLLIQYGTCTASSCLNIPSSLKSGDQFQCAETSCLYQEPHLSSEPRHSVFQLIVQFPNETIAQSTPPFIANFRGDIAGYRDRHFNITMQHRSLQVKPDDNMKPSRWETFGTALSLTELSKIAIALLAVLKFQKFEAVRVLLWIGFANLLTFPVMWFFFPSLHSFQYHSTRVFGVFSLLNAIAFSIVLVRRKPTIASLIRTAIAWFFCSPIVLIVAFIVASFFGYEEFLPSATGIPKRIILPVSEICVFIWEGWLLSCCQSSLSRRYAYLLSLLMNLFSLGLRLLLLPAL